jgi:hypothetical protein
MRETDSQSLSMPPLRSRRGRSLFDRLRQVGRPPGDAARATAATSEPEQQQPGSYDLFDGYTRAGAVPVPPAAQAPEQANGEAPVSDWDGSTTIAAAQAEMQAGAMSESSPPAERPSSYVEEAVALFNASEFPRRVAGVTRSLGAPMVNVRSAEHLSSVVTIVVAWELCWYRYEVDLSEPVVETQVIAQGTELTELTREDRTVNAAAADSGALVLTGV